jgi:hypothetical protein
MVSQSTENMENAAGSGARRRRAIFALLGLLAGMIVGGVISGVDYLIRGRNLRDVALTTNLLIYPLVGLGICWFGYRNLHMWRWVRPPGFFSVEPLPPEEAAARGVRIRRSTWIGFAIGIATAFLATALDFASRGWPFLAGTFIGSMLFYPYMGMLLGHNFALRPGDSKPSIRNFRFRMRTSMVLVAYVGVLFGLGTVASRHSNLAQRYHFKALGSKTMIDVFQTQVQKARADLERADSAKELRAGRIPDALLPSQKVFLKGLEGNATEEYKKYRYGLIADGEDLQAKLAAQNVAEFTARIAIYKKLVEKYDKAAQEPWVRVEPDPPMP